MKDWNNLVADENMILTKHFYPGRAGHSIKYIVVHHNAANLSIAGCYNTWQTREASAHYQVDANGRIGQLVHDYDTAWHAGATANRDSIGIEHADIDLKNWTISDATLDNGAHLVAALCHAYKLGRPQWNVNVFPHNHFMSTACPGAIAGSQNAAYMARAQKWYDAMSNGSSLPTMSVSTVQAAPTPAPIAKGNADIRAIQNAVHVAADNIWGRDTDKGTYAVRMASNYHGNKMPYGVAFLQKTVESKPDNILGPNTWAAHTAAVKKIQSAVGVNPDGMWGPVTEHALDAAYASSNHIV
jgi:hypothetical protein